MYDIPNLRLDREGSCLRDWNYLAWGSRCRREKVPPVTAYHFFVDDSKFSSLWRQPDHVVNTGVRLVVETDWSITDETAEAEAIYAIYRKRWLSRYWQDHTEIKVVVNLNVPERFARLNLDGVPKGWRSYATRGYRYMEESLEREWRLAVEHSGVEDVEFLVYGGGKGIKMLCDRRGWYFVDDHITEEMRKLREERTWGKRQGLAVITSDLLAPQQEG
jgi:hypothetical protein